MDDSSLTTQGWIDDKPCLVTVNTGAFLTCQVRHRRRIPRKEAETQRSEDSIGGDHSHLEGNVSKVDSGAVPTDDLGARRQYHRRVHPETGCVARPRCIPGFGAMCAMTV
jgi:hypothetical protein